MPPARRELVIAFALTAALLTEVLVVAPDPVSAVAALAPLALVARGRYPVAVVAALSAAVVGQLLRRRADLIAELDARAGALRAAREDAAAAAIAEERARLAIGVHDALAHRVGEITLQAAGAQRVAGEEPGRALAALARIEAAARGALDDIRGVIGVLRAGDELARGPAHVPEAVPAPWA